MVLLTGICLCRNLIVTLEQKLTAIEDCTKVPNTVNSDNLKREKKISNPEQDSPGAAEPKKDENKSEDQSRKTFKESLCEELQVDKSFLLYKGFYFLFFAGFGASFPYMALYFKQIGLNASSVGMLAGIKPIIQFISGPLWAVLADRYKARKAVLLFSILSWLVMTLALLIPRPCKTYCRNLTDNTNSNQSDTSIFTRRHSIRLSIDPQRPDKGTSLPVDWNLHHQRASIGNSPFRPLFLPNSQQETAYEVSSSKKYQLVYDEKEIYRVYIYVMILVVGG